jgi:endonuclease-3
MAKSSAKRATKKKTTRKRTTKSAPPASPELKARSRKIVNRLRKLYPEADCALQHHSAYQLLISVILSAQSTDETVNKVTPKLFEKYPDAESLAKADPEDVQRIIKPTGFFRNKSKSIMSACKVITEEHNGEVPDTMEALVALPGVARKTANVILGTWFGKNEGVVVDTHVGRLAHRLGLSWTSKDNKDAVKIEQDLMQVLPQKDWTFTGHALIFHGRRVCYARKPNCADCTLSDLCPSAFTFESAKATGTNKKAKKKKVSG